MSLNFVQKSTENDSAAHAQLVDEIIQLLDKTVYKAAIQRSIKRYMLSGLSKPGERILIRRSHMPEGLQAEFDVLPYELQNAVLRAAFHTFLVVNHEDSELHRAPAIWNLGYCLRVEGMKPAPEPQTPRTIDYGSWGHRAMHDLAIPDDIYTKHWLIEALRGCLGKWQHGEPFNTASITIPRSQLSNETLNFYDAYEPLAQRAALEWFRLTLLARYFGAEKYANYFKVEIAIEAKPEEIRK